MHERDIFLSALEINDPQSRAEHLKVACAGDQELLARIESLLASHEGPSQFLKTPVVEQLVEHENPKINATLMHDKDSNHDEEESEYNDDISLEYLSPSEHPGALGRLGHYDILEVIGRGAFGTVLRAFDEKLQRVVAIKVLAPEMAATSPARKRFLREARASAAIRHENVVAIHSVEDEPIPYLVMEYIPGKTLQKRLDEYGPLDISHVLQLGKQIADGLAAAHAVDLIHRDVKPGNILLEGGLDDRLKITDFGLARTADDASMTQSGIIAGTPLYMAPEQALGQKLDQRADLFSLGSVLYQMISGRPPFRAPNTLGVLKRVVEDIPRPIQDIIPETPSWLCEFVGFLHAKDPGQRYSSAKEVSQVLTRCLADLEAGRTPTITSPAHHLESPTTTNSKSLNVVVSRPLWKQPLAQVAAALVLLVGVGLLVTQFSRPGEALPLVDPKATTSTAAQTPTVVFEDIFRPKSVQWPADAPPLAIAPFTEDEAKQHRDAWAAYLNVPTEKSILLGQASDGKDIQLSLVLIPPGEFMMGTDDEELEKLRSDARTNGLRQADFVWIDAEGPQRRVRITRPFYMSRTEVTNAQFRCFVEDSKYETIAESSGKGSWVMKQGKMVLDPAVCWKSTGFPLADTAPVIHVCWHDANACCEWLTSQDSTLTFNLPTEAQWEYACRAGTTTPWYFGDDASMFSEYAIVDKTWMRWVGIKKPNAFGLYDMHGNVWEWCRDSFSNYRDGQTEDPIGPAEKKRIIRGGNFYGNNLHDWHNGNGRRSAARLEAPADHRILDKGFRVTAAISDEVIQNAIAAETGDRS